MNCQEFEAVVVELARGMLADASARERSLAHPDSCARCAARLAAERALCAGLRAAAATEASAPPRVEAALLAAFRAQHAGSVNTNNAPTRAVTLNLVSSDAAANDSRVAAQTTHAQAGAAVAASNVYSLEEAAARANARKAAPASDGAARGRSSSGWWLRVAAALLVAVTAGMTARLVWKSERGAGAGGALVQSNGDAANERRNDAATNANEDAAEEVRAVAVPETSPAVASDVTGGAPAPAGYRNVLMPEVPGSTDEGRAHESSPRFDPRRQTAAPRHAARGRGAGRLSREALGALVANSRGDGAAEPEVRTDFFPLSDASALPTMEGGLVVRVELPRAALVSFGLPVNAEQTTGRVKADVLIGHDGLARAVRFVR